MFNIPSWVITLVGALTAAVGVLTDPSNLALFPPKMAAVVTTIGVVVGVLGHIVAQYNTHQAIVATTPANVSSAAPVSKS